MYRSDHLIYYNLPVLVIRARNLKELKKKLLKMKAFFSLWTKTGKRTNKNRKSFPFLPTFSIRSNPTTFKDLVLENKKKQEARWEGY